MTATNGAVLEYYSYSPYGQQTIFDPQGALLSGSQAGVDTLVSPQPSGYAFTGRRYDPETGMLFFRARYYDVDLGRFISRDPLGIVDGMNVYAGYFAMMWGMDPSGMISQVVKFIQPDKTLGLTVNAPNQLGCNRVTIALTKWKAKPCCGKKIQNDQRLVFAKTIHSSDGDDVHAKVKIINKHSNVTSVRWQWQTCDRWDSPFDGLGRRGFKGSVDGSFSIDTHLGFGAYWWTFNGMAKAHFVVEYCDMTVLDKKGQGKLNRVHVEHFPTSVNGGRKATWNGQRPGQSASYQLSIKAK